MPLGDGKATTQYFITHSTDSDLKGMSHWSILSPGSGNTPEEHMRGCLKALSSLASAGTGTRYHQKIETVQNVLNIGLGVKLGKGVDKIVGDFSYDVMLGKCKETYETAAKVEGRPCARFYEAQAENGKSVKVIFTDLVPLAKQSAAWQDPLDLACCSAMAHRDTSATFVNLDGHTVLIVAKKSYDGHAIETVSSFISRAGEPSPSGMPIGLVPEGMNAKGVAGMIPNTKTAFTTNRKEVVRRLAAIQAQEIPDGKNPTTSMQVYTVNQNTLFAVAKSVWKTPDGPVTAATYYSLRFPISKEGKPMKPMYYSPDDLSTPIPVHPPTKAIPCMSAEHTMRAIHESGVHPHVIAKAGHTILLSAVIHRRT
jgi:hypothetical protein